MGRIFIYKVKRGGRKKKRSYGSCYRIILALDSRLGFAITYMCVAGAVLLSHSGSSLLPRAGVRIELDSFFFFSL